MKSMVLALLAMLALPYPGSGKARLATGYSADQAPLTPLAAAERHATAEVTSPFGMNVHLSLRFRGEDDPTDARQRALELMSQGGVAWTREEFTWSGLELSPHTTPRSYRYEAFDYDLSIGMLSEQGVNILGLLAYGPATNVDTDERYADLGECPPAVDDSAAPIDHWLPAWRDFVRTTVTQYGDRIRYWEIQNEPNTECFWRKVDKGAASPNASDYVKVLKAAYEEIHQADPQARVVLGGLVPEHDTPLGVDYFDYLQQIHDAGGWPYFDILAIHPYRPPHFPEQVLSRGRFDVRTLQYRDEPNQYNFTDEVLAFEQLMARWGKKPIWITEIGWATEDLNRRAGERGTQAEIVQSDYLIRTYVQAIAAGVQNVMWYDFRDDLVPDNPTESSFGLVRRDFSPKPAYYGFSTMASLLAGSEFQRHVRGQEDRNRPGDDDVHEVRFSKRTQTIVALWKSRGGDEPRTVRVDDIDAPTVAVFGPDFGPNTRDEGRVINTSNGAISLDLTERPLFIVFETLPITALEARLIGQSRVLQLQPGDSGAFHFDVQNTGQVTWNAGQGFLLESINHRNLGAPPAYALQSEVPPGQVTRWEIPVTAPDELGVYISEWQMTYRGTLFGPVMRCLVIVVPMPEGEGDFDPVRLLEEWVNDLVGQVIAKINQLLENLQQEGEELAQRELERWWREFWGNLYRQLCGASAIAPAVLLLGAWRINRTRRGGVGQRDRDD